VLVLSRDVDGLDMLFRHCPHAAVAVIGSEHSDNRLERIPSDVIWSRWLHDRRFHYDLILGAQDDLEELLDETQPQAVRSRVLDSEALIAVGVP
jgi:hypothetical protein